MAVGVRGGAEACPLAIEALLRAHTEYVAVKTDISNAFNSVDRNVVLQEGARCFPALAEIIRMSYGNTTKVIYTDSEGKEYHIRTNRGVTQGDPLGMLLFSTCIRRAVESTCKDHPDVVLTGFADDRYLVGEASKVRAALTSYMAELHKIGLKLQPTKSAVTTYSKDAAYVAGVKELFGAVPTTHTQDNASVCVPYADGFLVAGTPIGTN